jgi:hypothetical protein
MAIRRIPKSQYPLCQTCHIVRVKGRRNRFCSPGCIPKSERQAWCLKGRKTYAYRRRAVILKQHLDRLTGRHVTKEELLDVLWAYGKQQYANGYHVGLLRGNLLDAKARGAA